MPTTLMCVLSQAYVTEFSRRQTNSCNKREFLPGSVLVSYSDPRFNFHNYGSGLISKFKVHADFLDSNIRHHYGQPLGKFVRYHAVALVGH
jgi:hypothetical protein